MECGAIIRISTRVGENLGSHETEPRQDHTQGASRKRPQDRVMNYQLFTNTIQKEGKV